MIFPRNAELRPDRLGNLTVLLLPKEEGTNLGIVKRNMGGRWEVEVEPEEPAGIGHQLLPFDEMCSPVSWPISSSM